MIDKLKLKSKTECLRVGQVEDHEIGLTYEEIECVTCGGTGVDEGQTPNGDYYEDDCFDCQGTGVFYVTI